MESPPGGAPEPGHGLTLDDVLARLHGVRRIGSRWLALCPCHPDRHPSLTIGRGYSQAIVAKCHACGAGWLEVRQALGVVPGQALASAPQPTEETLRREARRAALQTQRWRRPGMLDLYAASDLYRTASTQLRQLRAAASRLPPALDATWAMEARAAALEAELRLLEHALDQWR